MYLAGIDIGTTSICVIVTNGEDGSVVRTLSKANDAALPSMKLWERAQNADRIVELVRELIEECRDDWNNVGAIGISCQMHGVLYADKEGYAVSPLFTWQDGRGDLLLESGKTYASTLSELTGYPLHTGFGLVTHFSFTKQREIPSGAEKLCTIGDYLAMQLCREKTPFIDSSNAASTGLFSLKNGEFDKDQLIEAGMEAGFLPELAHTAKLAGETADGKKVLWAIGDNQASFLGAVPSFKGTLLVNIGTGSQVSVYSPDYIECPNLETRPFIDGGFLLVGASLSGGKSYELLEQFFRDVCGAFGKTEERTLYEVMNRLAEEALKDPSPPLRVGTQFFGTREHPHKTGIIEGIRPDNFNAKKLTAAFLHGILDELDGFTKGLPADLLVQLTRLAVSGNGIRKNMAMQRLASSKWQLPITFAKVKEEAAFGAAVHAAVGSGLYNDYAEALQRMQRSDSDDK
ncbi:sedoheptulokinase [Paenibacillus sp. yr247]|uniref:sedoheptulokinase n=1 Tax=Paenibacillus sp. yr247 TaxID=1761880 RepID=UPI0008812B8E|nr:FGGY family carbohydrate kinase [Paenibacillus sp. yr247]SDO39177.1 sedoheptulokinase [Paenibacillus sp. yr247]